MGRPPLRLTPTPEQRARKQPGSLPPSDVDRRVRVRDGGGGNHVAAGGSIVGRMAAPGSRAGERQTPRHHRRLCTFCTCTLLLARSRHRRRRIKGRLYAHRRLCYCGLS